MGTFPVQQAQTWDEANPSEYTLLKQVMSEIGAQARWQDDLSRKMDRLEGMTAKLQEDVLVMKRVLMGRKEG